MGRIETYRQAFEDVIGIPYDKKAEKFISGLEKEGYTKTGILYVIYLKQEKLSIYKKDNRFFAILRNEVMKYSFNRNDLKYREYWKSKTLKQEQARYEKDAMNDKNLEKNAFDERKHKCKGFVYFVQGVYGGPIKIGYSKDPASRLKALQTSYPDELRILFVIPGSEITERYFHKEFELYKLKGEWFKPEQQLLDRIAKLKIKYSEYNENKENK